MPYYIVKTTCKNKKEAKFLAKLILEQKLAACAQISNIESLYHWNSKIEKDKENLLVLKIKKENYQQIEKLIIQNHSYENPQIIATQIKEASQDYLNWIDKNSV